MFENPKRGRQERNFTTNVPKILDLKSSSEQILSENWRWVPLRHGHALLSLSLRFSSKWRLREQKHSRTQRKCLQWRLTDVLSRNNRNHNRLRLLNKQNVVDRDRARILLPRVLRARSRAELPALSNGVILGDPGADSGDEGKSKRAEKYDTKKSKERREEPLGTMSYQTSSKRSPPFCLLIGQKNTKKFSGPNQKSERRRPFGTG